MKLLSRLADNTNPHSLANRFRRRRQTIFREFVADLPRPIKILDLGGTEDFWIKTGWAGQEDVSVTLVNLSPPPSTRPNFSAVAGDARSLPAFGDFSFDVVFSNSVIEHVGDFDDQQSMAREVLRLGRRYFVQTPSPYFPIEPHFLFPYFALLPQRVKEELLCRFSLGWYQRQANRGEARKLLRSFRLLTRAELRRLFPQAHLITERFSGFPKSYIALGFREPPLS